MPRTTPQVQPTQPPLDLTTCDPADMAAVLAIRARRNKRRRLRGRQ